MDKLQLIPSHAIGTWLLGIIHRFLAFIGVERSQTVEEWLYIAIIAAISLCFGWIIRWVVVFAVRKLVELRHGSFGTELLEQHTISRCSHFIPPLVFMAFIPLAFNSGSHTLDIIERVVGAYSLIALGIGIAAVMEFAFYRYNKHDNTRNLPLKGILNIGRGISWIIIAIIVVSILVDKSPAVLLTGLGAFAAALMLIFKDSILGFVAGIQMSQNDMLHVGDWIVVPGTPANGTVQDVSLSAVKIRNFDNTFVTVPPYTLVSGSFQNYRGMKEAGARRLDPSLTIAMSSVSRCTPDMIDKALAAHPEIKPFVDKLQKADSTVAADPGIRPLNGTTETNLGLFRAYAAQYLLTSPLINHDMQVLVRILEPTDNGLPLQFYCFAHTTDWNEYEAIRSTVIENFTVAAADFGLEIYYGGSYDITTVNADTDADTGTTADDTKKA